MKYAYIIHALMIGTPSLVFSMMAPADKRLPQYNNFCEKYDISENMDIEARAQKNITALREKSKKALQTHLLLSYKARYLALKDAAQRIKSLENRLQDIIQDIQSNDDYIEMLNPEEYEKDLQKLRQENAALRKQLEESTRIKKCFTAFCGLFSRTAHRATSAVSRGASYLWECISPSRPFILDIKDLQ